jgi:hypothetical protein
MYLSFRIRIDWAVRTWTSNGPSASPNFKGTVSRSKVITPFSKSRRAFLLCRNSMPKSIWFLQGGGAVRVQISTVIRTAQTHFHGSRNETIHLGILPSLGHGEILFDRIYWLGFYAFLAIFQLYYGDWIKCSVWFWKVGFPWRPQVSLLFFDNKGNGLLRAKGILILDIRGTI